MMAANDQPRKPTYEETLALVGGKIRASIDALNLPECLSPFRHIEPNPLTIDQFNIKLDNISNESTRLD